MFWKEALALAQRKLADANAGRKEIDRLYNKRQMKKFCKGFGRVRELAGLSHTRVAK